MKHSSIILPLALLLSAAPLAAQENRDGVLFFGGSAGDGVSAYAGGLVSLPGARLGQGFALRGSANAGRYKYQQGVATVEADYVGAEAALVYQTSAPWGWANFSAGPRLTDTSLSPRDPANERSGTRVDAVIGAEGNYRTGGWSLGWYGNAGLFDETYYTQLRAGHRIDSAGRAFLGIEGGFQGDPSYDSRNIGLFYARDFSDAWNVQLSGGIRDQEGRKVKPYAAIGLSRLF
ncbi:cellulose biosynthesis protein BcsS [Allosphingosinicella flava]|uniref:Cellulose biosynthesis protein BcsS n=1 Tax=Allosphingosinicella flava TaxID=2771430 RepID=A0A7T2GJD2_9SPHN|nr:cellulose biosynthesis protein BcsS [Sphingosinicella flava]QPQ54976.1 cellulose biosynthesis protein BcsS [Sphingosinicella flava]